MDLKVLYDAYFTGSNEVEWGPNMPEILIDGMAIIRRLLR